MSNLLTTAECSKCRLPFKLTRGYVRFHRDHLGNSCPGSGLAPYEPLLRMWADGAA